ncbi:MAG: hypothetical protein AAGA66_03135 [Bacteroidota bacterium]
MEKYKPITLTRASVAAGDDMDAPHFRKIDIASDWKIERILLEVLNANYLPSIAGKATWSVAINEPIAVINQGHDRSIKLITLPGYPHQGTGGFVDIKTIHFNYHAQQDAGIVFDVLRRFDLNE